MRTMVVNILVAVLLMGLLLAQAARGEGEDDVLVVLDTAGFWRMNYTFTVPVYLKDGRVTPMPTTWRNRHHKFAEHPTSWPVDGWRKPDFDDSGWIRIAGLPYASTVRNTDRKSAWMTLLAVRGKFVVTNPSRAKDLTLEADYRGGIVVCLNGEEIVRRHLAKDAKRDTLAEPTKPGEKSPRTLRCTVPAKALRKGTNVLAIEVHRAPLRGEEINLHLTKWPQGVNIERASCALERIRLSASKAGAVVPNVVRPKGLQVWNSSVLASDFDMDFGDPFEPVRPIRIVGTRNGAFSGKVVVGSDAPIANLKATMSELRAFKGNGKIPTDHIEVRYALSGGVEEGANPRYLLIPNRFEPLAEVPPAEVPVVEKGKARVRKGRYNPWHNLESPGIKPVFGAVCPVWVTVNIPKNASPGDYRGTITITAKGERPVRVPVDMTVCAWTLPDSRDYRTFAEVVQSPETLAMAYEVPLWSDEHFALIDRSMKLIARSGAPSVYVPLICETNLGNAESMVRWIRSDDGTYRHDFTPMERYLDVVEKYRGKPEVVCFWMWDTFLERTLGGRGDEKWNSGDVVKALKEAKGHGPDVTLLDPKTGKTEKLELPQYTDPKSQALWKPLADELIRRMKKRGWLDVAMLGTMCDYQPSEAARKHLLKVFPDMRWVSHAHLKPRKDLPVGCAATVFWEYRRYRDPSIARAYGWKNDKLFVHFPRLLRPWFSPVQFRLVNEMDLMRGFRGSARFGGDFFPVLKDKRGRLRGTIAGRYPKSHWHNLRIETNFLEKGEHGAIGTTLYEVFREGVQECEARIFIENALTDKTLRAKLGEVVASRCRKVLDDRSRDVRSGVSTFVQSGHYRQHHTDFGNWWQAAGILGGQWYASSGWQDRSKELFDAAAEVTRKIGNH